MALGHIPDYSGGNNGVEWYRDGEGGVYVKIYNDGTAKSNGVVYELTFTSSSSVVYADVVAPSTIATATAIIGVINNAPKGLDTIPASNYGWLQIAGYCPYVATSGSVAANDQLEVITGGVALIDQGTNGGALMGANSVGVAIANVTTNVWSARLFGRPVVVAGS